MIPVIGSAEPKVKRLKVVVPSHDTVPALFAADLAQMMTFTTSVLPSDGGTLLGLNFTIGTYIHRARQEILFQAIEEDVDYLLWLDSDMRFPEDLFVRLLQHRTQVVGINYSMRRVPPEFVAIKHLSTGLEDPSQRLITAPDSTGLEEVDAVGFGAVLMRMDAINGLPSPREQQWFGHEYVPERMDWIGEDVLFCKLLRESGVKLYVDHDLSKECLHVGQYEYGVQDVWAYQAGLEEK